MGSCADQHPQQIPRWLTNMTVADPGGEGKRSSIIFCADLLWCCFKAEAHVSTQCSSASSQGGLDSRKLTRVSMETSQLVSSSAAQRFVLLATLMGAR